MTLLGSDSAQKSAPKSVEAHNAYLQGHFHLLRRNVEDYRKAIGYYDQAIELDPAYALAYAERAEAWTFLGTSPASARRRTQKGEAMRRRPLRSRPC